MKPPKPFKVEESYSKCIACDQWRHNNRFYHEGAYWILCAADFADYWENTDELLEDFRMYW